MKLVSKKIFGGLLALFVLPVSTYSMEQLPSMQEPTLLVHDEQKNMQGEASLQAAEAADRCTPILKQDHDGQILWGNIATVVAFALVVSYAFYQ
jgi:hypothetical protein